MGLDSQNQTAASLLASARDKAHLSLRDLAQKAGTSHATLSAYEKGRKTPSVVTFLRILEACGNAVDIELHPRIRERDGIDRGEELEAALRLAAQFPARAERHLNLPVFQMDDLIGKIVELHQQLNREQIPHAFGGALALAWCTQRARGTIDIDVNLLLPADHWQTALEALPAEVRVTRKDEQLFKRDGQVRVWWEKTPLDLFLNSTDFHDGIGERIRWERFAGESLPFLSCFDLAVFKAFFNRTKDWADLEEMASAGTLQHTRVQATLIDYLGADDERIEKLSELARQAR